MSLMRALAQVGKYYLKGAIITIPFCVYDIYQNRPPHPFTEYYILGRIHIGLSVCFWPIYWKHKFRSWIFY